MAFVTWDWNEWIDAALQGRGEQLLRGLLKAVSTHNQVRQKRGKDLLAQYGVESVNELAQALAIKILADKVLVSHSRDTGLSDEDIGKRINHTIGNLLIDMHRNWNNRRTFFDNALPDFFDKLEDSEQDPLERFLSRRLVVLQSNPEEQAILQELVVRFYRSLTPRQKFIFDKHEDFGHGKMTGEEVGQELKMGKSTLYAEMRRIWKRLGYALGA